MVTLGSGRQLTGSSQPAASGFNTWPPRRLLGARKGAELQAPPHSLPAHGTRERLVKDAAQLPPDVGDASLSRALLLICSQLLAGPT